MVVWMMMLLYYLHSHAGPAVKVAQSTSAVIPTTRPLQNVRAVVTDAPRTVLSGASDRPVDHVHVIFSTDCEFYQDWQTLVLFQSAFIVGQEKYGPVTRIASGCSDAKMA